MILGLDKPLPAPINVNHGYLKVSLKYHSQVQNRKQQSKPFSFPCLLKR